MAVLSKEILFVAFLKVLSLEVAVSLRVLLTLLASAISSGLVAPFVFFDDSKNATIEEFIRETATMKFPELGVVSGKEVLKLIEDNFAKHGSVETKNGEVNFWAIKS